MIPDIYSITSIMDSYADAKQKASTYDEEDKISILYANAMQLLFKIGFGDIFIVDDFIRIVESGGFTDYDGHGYFITNDGTEKRCIHCDADWLRRNRDIYAFIAWYNK